MKAAIYTHYGGPEVVRIGQMPEPVPQANEIRIRIYATTINRTDCGFRSAEYFVSRLFSGLFRPRQQVLGCEFAGVIDQVGEQVSRFKVGDAVFGYDDKSFGGHAEFKVIHEDHAVDLLPQGWDFSHAAAMTEGSHYALGNIRAAKIKPGDVTLVYGATGAIGSAAVQLLKHFGAYVVAVSNTKNLELVRSLGADEVIDYQNEDFTRTQHRFDFVFDAVGKSSFAVCKPLMTSKGVYISTELGERWENIGYALLAPFSKSQKVLFPIPGINLEDVAFLRKLALHGAFKPVVDRIYPFEALTEAYQYVETGQKTGNVVLRIIPVDPTSLTDSGPDKIR